MSLTEPTASGAGGAATLPPYAPKLNAGQVVSEAVSLAWRTLLPASVATVIGFIVPIGLLMAASALVATQIEALAGPPQTGFIILLFLFSFAAFAPMGWACIHVLQLQLDRQSGLEKSIWSGWGQSLRNFLPVTGLVILSYIAFSIGFLLLIVPGVFLLVIWAVALPVLLSEGGILHALRRSAELTKGHRWRVLLAYFLIFLVTVVVQFAVMVPMTFVAGLIGAFGSGSVVAGVLVSVLFGVMSVVYMAAYLGVFCAFLVVLYDHLRRLQDGHGLNDMGEVFS